ncbi:uncharacterized protein TNCV_4837651 [Trichonephila clavipes]|nr:uncharacterized protein TNCV_4837651 [Trichonephila clavipes]
MTLGCSSSGALKGHCRSHSKASGFLLLMSLLRWNTSRLFKHRVTQDSFYLDVTLINIRPLDFVTPCAVDFEDEDWCGNCADYLTVGCIKREKIELREDLKSRRGLAVSLEIICHNCGESTSTMSSKISNKCYDVNLRLTYGMRAIGKGGAAARIFCGLMNLPPPPAKFERHNSLFLNVLKTISEDSMNAAVHEAVIANDNNSNIAVAVDGTWHKRGYSSLNGVVCATSLSLSYRL